MDGSVAYSTHNLSVLDTPIINAALRDVFIAFVFVSFFSFITSLTFLSTATAKFILGIASQRRNRYFSLLLILKKEKTRRHILYKNFHDSP